MKLKKKECIKIRKKKLSTYRGQDLIMYSTVRSAATVAKTWAMTTAEKALTLLPAVLYRIRLRTSQTEAVTSNFVMSQKLPRKSLFALVFEQLLQHCSQRLHPNHLFLDFEVIYAKIKAQDNLLQNMKKKTYILTQLGCCFCSTVPKSSIIAKNCSVQI
jgi:hypothetical protein